MQSKNNNRKSKLRSAYRFVDFYSFRLQKYNFFLNPANILQEKFTKTQKKKNRQFPITGISGSCSETIHNPTQPFRLQPSSH
jgi:hypothetical protein